MFKKDFVVFLKSNQTKFLFLIFTLSFIIRFGFLVSYAGDSSYSGINSTPWSSADDARYEKVALSLIKSGLSGVIKDYPILQGHLLYPLFIAGIYSIFGHHYFMVRFIQAFLSSTSCILFFFIGKNIFNKKVGILTYIYSSLYPIFIYLNGRFLTETLFIFLLSIAILFLIKIYKEPTTMNAIWAGIFLGLCILTRSMLLGFIPFLLFWIVMILKEKKKITAISLSLIISLTIIIIPWIILNAVVESPASQGIGRALWGWNNP
jgi:4-amino-4-deoxy-L-arabinose transferase-like glycosyltransferase